MKRTHIIAALIAVLIVGMFAPDLMAQTDGFTTRDTFEQVDNPGPFFFFGPRLYTDATFYVQGGFKTDNFDATVAIGFNDSVRIGAHGYFLEGEGISAAVFAGVELHIDNSGPVMTMNPAFSIGVAINEGPMLFIIDALLGPAVQGDPVTAVVAMSLNFGWSLE